MSLTRAHTRTGASSPHGPQGGRITTTRSGANPIAVWGFAAVIQGGVL
jgi:hypothetical protein